ncbi:hypothetical protein GP486_002804 [Trichoglossum hirsutum]|uniref:JmjC domain-containing protein n=1 Tax=Trichoglossum hirsutum TaxID=265104 RepID=A0A9P8LEJ1_9PEZI|nr:hypothetical protein GP486_002804 [Trichoglossum hirsutum]
MDSENHYSIIEVDEGDILVCPNCNTAVTNIGKHIHWPMSMRKSLARKKFLNAKRFKKLEYPDSRDPYPELGVPIDGFRCSRCRTFSKSQLYKKYFEVTSNSPSDIQGGGDTGGIRFPSDGQEGIEQDSIDHDFSPPAAGPSQAPIPEQSSDSQSYEEFKSMLKVVSGTSHGYLQTVSEFLKIMEKAVPADSSCISFLSNEEIVQELGERKPIVVRNSGDECLKTIKDFFRTSPCILRREVDVQDPYNTNDDSYTRRTMDDVRKAFEMGPHEREEREINYNLLDVHNHWEFLIPPWTSEVHLLKDVIDSLRDIPTAHRRIERPGFKNYHSWLLMSLVGKPNVVITGEHLDTCGFFSYITVLEGRKLWAIFYNEVWRYIWLEPGDSLVMPPGTPHAVGTPCDTLCVGGHFWTYEMDQSLGAIEAIVKDPGRTNDWNPGETQEILKGLIQVIHTCPERFGNERVAGLLSRINVGGEMPVSALADVTAVRRTGSVGSLVIFIMIVVRTTSKKGLFNVRGSEGNEGS